MIICNRADSSWRKTFFCVAILFGLQITITGLLSFMIGLQRVYRIIRPRNLSSEFNVPGWEKGVSLAARDYVDYEKQTSVLMPARITEDISLWHPGTCVESHVDHEFWENKTNKINRLLMNFSDQELSVLIGVESSADSFDTRQVIRDTWGENLSMLVTRNFSNWMKWTSQISNLWWNPISACRGFGPCPANAPGFKSSDWVMVY